MRKSNLHIDEHFLKVHPDLAALFKEIREKENALRRLKARRAALKEDIKSSKRELEKRLAVLENWQRKGQDVQ